MKNASSVRVTNLLEESLFTWNNLELIVKSSKECTPIHFSQVFGFFEEF